MWYGGYQKPERTPAKPDSARRKAQEKQCFVLNPSGPRCCLCKGESECLFIDKFGKPLNEPK